MHTHDQANSRRSSFWSDYPAWLASNRRVLFVLSAAMIGLFVIALVMSATPQDPFTYDLY